MNEDVAKYCEECLDFVADDQAAIEARLLRERVLWEINGHRQSSVIVVPFV